MNKGRLQLWINALESGEYQQGKTVLHNITDNTYCCLGVLCDVAMKDGVELEVTTGEHFVSPGRNISRALYNNMGGLPPSAIDRWLDTDAHSIRAKINEYTDYLTNHNDSGKATFKDIAAALKKLL